MSSKNLVKLLLMEVVSLRLSILDLVPVLTNASSVDAIAQALKLAQAAEQWGYQRYWVAEHHDMQGLACTSPEVLLAYIGANTSRIRLGSGATLLHLLKKIYQLENQPVFARPIPPEAPDVWLLGTNHKSAAYAAEFGTGYVFGQFMSDRNALEVISKYREQFIPTELAQEPRVIMAMGIICADTEDEAKKSVTEVSGLLKPLGVAETELPEFERKLLVGTPSQIKAHLEAIQKLTGVEEFLIVTMVADYEKRLRSYELLAKEIAD
jgi:alkanesulfonate monooxygenase SsuD/methylene tetrahydromethanopterin reductase-like flavin-dependent oxidoreductase (luciferase family)